MSPVQIKKALKRRKITQARIARELGKSAAAVSLVVNRKSRSRIIEEHVAGLLGKRRFDIWKPTRATLIEDG